METGTGEVEFTIRRKGLSKHFMKTNIWRREREIGLERRGEYNVGEGGEVMGE